MQIVDSLQAEKAGLDARLGEMRTERDRLEAENARLRAVNLERDRQMALLLSSLKGRITPSQRGRDLRLQDIEFPDNLPVL